MRSSWPPTTPLVSVTNPRAPFGRVVDLWWHAIELGVVAGERIPLPTPVRPTLVNFSEADILQSDPWRVTHLELLVLGEQGVDAGLQSGHGDTDSQ